jgi:hypothetical protein
MKKFIITEEEKNHIKGLYEQVQQKSGCTGNPNSINVLSINVYIDKSLFVGDNGYLANQLFEGLEDYSNSNPFNVGIEFSKNIPLNNTQRLLQFQVDATYQNSLKQTGWVNKYFEGFTKILKSIPQMLSLVPNNFKVSEAHLSWGDYFESEPTSCPDLCSGGAYRIDYTPPQ